MFKWSWWSWQPELIKVCLVHVSSTHTTSAPHTLHLCLLFAVNAPCLFFLCGVTQTCFIGLIIFTSNFYHIKWTHFFCSHIHLKLGLPFQPYPDTVFLMPNLNVSGLFFVTFHYFPSTGIKILILQWSIIFVIHWFWWFSRQMYYLDIGVFAAFKHFRFFKWLHASHLWP